MKTKEQIIEWLKGQEWFKEFCCNAGFHDEGELEEYVESMMNRPKYLMSAAFVWPEMERDYWSNCEYDYLKWLHNFDGKESVPNKAESVPNDNNFVFAGGTREAPFYVTYSLFADENGEHHVSEKFKTFEEAVEEAERLSKISGYETIVLAAVGTVKTKIHIETDYCSAADMDWADYETLPM